MHRSWLFLILLWISLEGIPKPIETPMGASAEACWKEIQSIDQLVQKLSKEKEIHIELSRKYQKEGDNWLYSSGSIQDGYRAWGMADDERRKAAALQEQIDHLLQRKQHIYQFFPELRND